MTDSIVMRRRIVNALFPYTCALCGKTSVDSRLCEYCLASLPWNEIYCETCGGSLERRQPPGVDCATCQRRPPVIRKARARLRYEFPVDAALKKLKFRRQLFLAPAFADLLIDTITAEFGRCDALVPVPLHRWRHIMRGYNQADEIAKALGACTGLPLFLGTVRTRATAPQTGLSASARRRNVRDAFRVTRPLKARHPLIVDDVVTTGSTCDSLARTLLAAGATTVSAIAVAHS